MFSVTILTIRSSAIADRPRCRRGAVLANSGRYSADIIGQLQPLCQSTYKAMDLGEIMQNKGYYAVQGHLRSPMSVPIENARMRLPISERDTLSRTVSKLSQVIVQIMDEKRSLCLFQPASVGDLGTTCAVHLRLIGKPVYGLSIRVN